MNDIDFPINSEIFSSCIQEAESDIGGEKSEVEDKIDSGKKIWIDDIREAPEGYIWFKTVNDFIDYCHENGIDDIELFDTDHDAGDYQSQGGDYIRCFDYLDFCGCENVTIHIHSANPVGANNIRRIITKNKDKGWKEIRNVNEEEIDSHNIPQQSIDNFIETTAEEISNEINESEENGENDINEIKLKMYEFISSIKTKEDIDSFVHEFEPKIKEIQNSDKYSSVKKYLLKIWNVLKYVLKIGIFAIQNIDSLAILASIIYVCYEYGIGPIEAVKKAYEVAKLVVQAAKITVDAGVGGVKAFKKVQEISSEVGGKIGEFLGTHFPSVFESQVENILEDTTPQDITESIHINLNDDTINKSKCSLIAYNIHVNENDDSEAYNPKKNPDKAIDILMEFPQNHLEIEIFLDTPTKEWDSLVNGSMKLSPDQMEDFFKTDFYRKLYNKLVKTWPNTDDMFNDLLNAIKVKKYRIDGFVNNEDKDDVNEESGANQFGTGIVDPSKSREKDEMGKQIRTRSGRKYIQPSDFSVKHSDKEAYFCWPDNDHPLKWSQWGDWEKIHPLARMRFEMGTADPHLYGISISPLEESNENRGFRGYDLTAQPPLQYLTPEETDMIMDLSIVKKFLKNITVRITKYLDMPDDEILKATNNPEKCSLEDIRKTKRHIRYALEAIKNRRADNYIYTD